MVSQRRCGVARDLRESPFPFDLDLHDIDEGPRAPVRLVRLEQDARWIDVIDPKRPAADQRAARSTNDDRMSRVRECPRQVRHRLAGVDRDRVAFRGDLPRRFAAAKRRRRLPRLELRPVVQDDAAPQLKSPAAA